MSDCRNRFCFRCSTSLAGICFFTGFCTSCLYSYLSGIPAMFLFGNRFSVFYNYSTVFTNLISGITFLATCCFFRIFQFNIWMSGNLDILCSCKISIIGCNICCSLMDTCDISCAVNSCSLCI